MAIEYRKLTFGGLTMFIQMRINQLQEESAKAVFDSRDQQAKWACLHAHLATAARVTYPVACSGGVDLRSALMDYDRRHLADNTFVSWIALEKEKMVAASGIIY